MANPYSAQWNNPKGIPTFPVGGPTVFGQTGGGVTSPWAFGGAGGGSLSPKTTSTLPTSTENWRAGMPLIPGLTGAYGDWLGSQVGAGAKPFDLTSWLPSSGRETQPGQLSADVNPVLAQLMEFLQGQLADPSQRLQPRGGVDEALAKLLDPNQLQPVGGATLEEMIKTGMPISQTPAWTAMTKALERTYQKGGADIRAQLAGLGLIAGTPHETAQTDYALQSSRERAGLLGSMEAGALESARGRQISALGLSRDFAALSTDRMAKGLQLAQGFFSLDLDQQKTIIDTTKSLGELFQGMDQNAIDRTFAEFMRTRPEYGPLLQFIQQLATTFPQFLSMHTGLGGVGAVVGNIGTATEAGKNIMEILKGIKQPTSPAPPTGGVSTPATTPPIFAP